MNQTVIKLVLCLKLVYVIMIFAVIANRVGGYFAAESDRILKIKDLVSTLYTFIMALVLFNLFI